MISWSSSTASSTPATSLNPIFGVSGAMRLARDLPKLITFEPPPCTWFIRKIQNPIRSRKGRNDPIRDVHEKPPALGVPLDALLLEQVLEGDLRLIARRSGRSRACRPVELRGEIERLPGLKSAEATWPPWTSLIACEVVSFVASLFFGIRVWLASQTSKTITMSGKNALRRKRFTIGVRSA